MSRNKTILVIGILMAVMPFLGFPSGWKTVLYVLSGFILICIAAFGHVRRRSSADVEHSEVVTEIFVESN